MSPATTPPYLPDRQTSLGCRARPSLIVVLALVVTIATSCGSGLDHAFAQTGGGELGHGYVRATAADLGSGTFEGGGVPARSPSAAPPFTWVRVVRQSRCVVFAGPVPDDAHASPVPGASFGFPIDPGSPIRVPPTTVLVNADYPLPDGARDVGQLVQDVGDDPSRTDDLVIVPRCLGPGTPPMAAVPSAAEIWQETPLPRAVVEASPPGTAAWPGITRLGSDFRSGPVAPASAAVSLRGYDVVATAVPVAYAWTFGDGNGMVTHDVGGVPRVAYLRRGDYTVTRFVVWEGTAEIRAFGGLVARLDLGTVTIPERMPYHVAEIRAVLRTTPGRR